MESIKKYWFVFMAVFVVLMFVEPIYCAILFGALLLFLSLAGILFLKKIQRVGIQCQGKLIGFETDVDGDRIPLIEFKTAEGKLVKGKPYVSIALRLNGIRLSRNKEHVPVLISHLPDQPKKFILVNKTGPNYLVLILFGLFGVAFLVLALLQLFGYIQLF